MRSARLLLLLAGTSLGAPLQLEPSQIETLQISWSRPEEVTSYPVAQTFARVETAPGSEWHLQAPLAGRVEAVLVSPGKEVEEGEGLLELFSPELLQLEAQLLLAEREWRTASRHYERLKPLAERGAIPKGRWLEVARQWREAGVRLQAARSQLLRLGVSEAQIASLSGRGRAEGRFPIAAPARGRVGEISVRLGQWVGPGTPLLKLLPEKAPLLLEVVLPLEWAQKVAPGDLVRWQGGEAEVVGSAPEVAESQTRLLYAEPRRGELLAGERLTVEVYHRTQRPLWRLPVSALFRHRDRFWIFTHRQGGFEPLPVSPTALSGRWAYLEPLPSALEVVTSGTSALKAIWLGEE